MHWLSGDTLSFADALDFIPMIGLKEKKSITLVDLINHNYFILFQIIMVMKKIILLISCLLNIS